MLFRAALPEFQLHSDSPRVGESSFISAEFDGPILIFNWQENIFSQGGERVVSLGIPVSGEKKEKKKLAYRILEKKSLSCSKPICFS